jgi:hypothetical protein
MRARAEEREEEEEKENLSGRLKFYFFFLFKNNKRVESPAASVHKTAGCFDMCLSVSLPLSIAQDPQTSPWSPLLLLLLLFSF